MFRRPHTRCLPSARPLQWLGGLAALTVIGRGQTLYDFGNPTAEEQQFIELINRARANPPSEGIRLATTTDPNVLSAYSYFGVDLAMMQSEFNAIPAQPPLAPNASLTTSARGHSAWMFTHVTQDHYETNPANDPFMRMTAAGYTYTTAAENIYSWANSAWHGHAGFQVDWGTGGTGGMQGPPRAHRVNIHSSSYREIGVGVTLGTNGPAPDTVGPVVVTQDFGTSTTNPTLATGVAYYDLNSNNTYDAGEGIAGLTVNVGGLGVSQYCITAIGGGWVVPIPTTATTRTVTFSGLTINQTANLVVPTATNAKADLKLAYAAPTITSPTTASAGTAHTLTFTAIGGATGYKWNLWTAGTAAAETCDSTGSVTAATTGSYSIHNTTVKQEGSASFHLENSTGADQSIQLNGLYYGQSAPTLTFQSQIRYATTAEFFKVQVKEEGSLVWQDVLSQAGTNTSGDAGFALRTAALPSMSGKSFRVRFLLNSTGSYFGTSGDIVGWFIDAISFSDVSSLDNNVLQTLSGTSGRFTPSAGTYLMSVTPVISSRDFPASYQTLTVTCTFVNWASAIEASNSLPAASISTALADYDHDGRSNLIEYAFGTSPIVGNDSAPRMPVAIADASAYTIQYQRDTALTDITLTAQASTNLETWKAPGEPGAPAGFADKLISTAGTLETRRASVPRSSGNKVFIRIRVTQP